MSDTTITEQPCWTRINIHGATADDLTAVGAKPGELYCNKEGDRVALDIATITVWFNSPANAAAFIHKLNLMAGNTPAVNAHLQLLEEHT